MAELLLVPDGCVQPKNGGLQRYKKKCRKIKIVRPVLGFGVGIATGLLGGCIINDIGNNFECYRETMEDVAALDQGLNFIFGNPDDLPWSELGFDYPSYRKCELFVTEKIPEKFAEYIYEPAKQCVEKVIMSGDDWPDLNQLTWGNF